MMKSVNPASGEMIQAYEAHSEKGVEKIINSVDKRWQTWRKTSFSQRGLLMQNLSSLLKSNKGELARLMALEMGKVLREGIAEIEKCVDYQDWYHYQ